jgi:pimeloyl-ACP methyl ester carboxylesterase
MSKVYLIPGLGADSRIYQHIDLSGYDVVEVNWIKPAATDTLTTYSQKLIDEYDITPNGAVIGNSLGGMIAIEIGKLIAPKKIILVSSIRTVDEAPGYFRIFRKVPVYKAVPDTLFTSVDFLLEVIFGEMSAGEKKLFKDMIKNTSPEFMKWAMEAILKWDNKVIPQNVYQISGDRDMVFPYKNLKAATIVKGGTHIMIFDKAPELNKLIKEILEK